MTQEELIKEIKELPPQDQKALLEVILQLVGDERSSSVPKKSVAERLHGIAKPKFGTRDESQDSQRLTLSQRLYGILKFDGEPPNDDEVKDLIADYLIRKYS